MTVAAPKTAVPRPASLVVLLAVGTGLIVAAATGGTAVGVAVTAAAGGGLGLGTLSRARDGPARAAVGAALAPIVALGIVVGIALVAAGRGGLDAVLGGAGFAAGLPAVTLGLGAFVAAVGAVVTLGDGVGPDAIGRMHRSVLATATVVALAFGTTLVARFDALGALPASTFDPGALFDPLLSPDGPTVALVTFFGLVVAAAVACRATLSTLPVAELAPRERREAVTRTVERLDADLRLAAKYGVVAASVSLPTAIPAVREALPVVAVATLLAGAALRGLLLLVVAVAATLALVGRLLRAAAGETAAALGRLLPATAGGGVAVIAALGASGAIRRVAAGSPDAVRPVAVGLLDALSPAGVALGAVAVALAVLTAGLTGLVALFRIGLVPARGSGGALAGAGLSACAVVLGVGAAPPLSTFALVGLGVVAWDVSDRSVAVRADLGAGAGAGTAIEVVHAVGSAAVAVVGVVVAWAALGLAGAVALPDGALIGTVAAVAGAVLLLGVLRG